MVYLRVTYLYLTECSLVLICFDSMLLLFLNKNLLTGGVMSCEKKLVGFLNNYYFFDPVTLVEWKETIFFLIVDVCCCDHNKKKSKEFFFFVNYFLCVCTFTRSLPTHFPTRNFILNFNFFIIFTLKQFF
jgi:hypothetical protein